MVAAIDRLFETAQLHCSCCGADAHWYDGNVYCDCVCARSYMQRCAMRGRCLEHCICRDCKLRRKSGLHRVNYSGIYHLYFQGAEKSLCNRAVPAARLGIVHAPANALTGRECKRCAKLSGLGG